MPNILVYMDSDGERPSEAGLEALGLGRRIATDMGAVLLALVAAPAARETESVLDQDETVTLLGECGADKIVLMTVPRLPGPHIWATHGAALLSACRTLHPLLVLLPATGAGNDIGPRLAASLRSAFIGVPTIEYGDGDLIFWRSVYGATYRRRLAASQFDEPIVATTVPGAHKRATGYDEAEIILLDGPTEVRSGIEFLTSKPDPGATLETARIVVIAGAGVRTAEDLALVEQLAEELGAEFAATRSLCARGSAPADREVGVGSRHLRPTVLVLCGVSGSSATLGALDTEPTIIAIGSDPKASVFRVADYGIVGEVGAIVPDLIRVLRERNTFVPPLVAPYAE